MLSKYKGPIFAYHMLGIRCIYSVKFVLYNLGQSPPSIQFHICL